MWTAGTCRLDISLKSCFICRKYGRDSSGSSLYGGTAISPQNSNDSSSVAAPSNCSNSAESGAIPL